MEGTSALSVLSRQGCEEEEEEMSFLYWVYDETCGLRQIPAMSG